MLDLCDRLLDLNPEMRPTTQQIFFHPFLRDMLPTNQLVEIDVLKKCELPLLNMVMRNVECFCLIYEMKDCSDLLGQIGMRRLQKIGPCCCCYEMSGNCLLWWNVE